jgi:hypothetical protein
VGDPVGVTHESLMKYGNALCEYALTIVRRLDQRYNLDLEKGMREADEEKEVVSIGE